MNVSVSCATVIRFFVYGLPTLLVALIAAAFVNVSLLSANKKNEMSIGTLGEPSTLNPIQQADAAAGEVQAVIFNGLLKYDQNLEITTDLAKSFSLSQTTTHLLSRSERGLDRSPEPRDPTFAAGKIGS